MFQCLQGWAGLSGARATDGALRSAAQTFATISAAALLVAFALLIVTFLQSDFSVALVANNSHSAKPLLYKIAGTWGNHEGSMLLWCLVSAIYGAALASFGGRLVPSLQSRALGIQGLLGAMTLVYLILASNPFARLDPAPLEGADLNPLLQDPALAIHPPMLYLGYVGFSLVFSLAIAALIEGKVDRAWASWVRPWALTAWAFLTFGIGLGSWWAYYELGWGGWWFWDPVENASFMPWLAGAALVHSAIITEKRGTMASWTILLAILTFVLSMLGAFLVRSGVLTSVHAFAVDPERGLWILGMLGIVAVGGFSLYAWKSISLVGRPAAFDIVSRDGALILNNLFLTVACGTVLVGTLYPLAVEAVADRAISVGPPYFNLTFTPLMATLIVALPFAPFLAWRKASLTAAMPRLWLALGLAVAAAVLTLILHGFDKTLAALGFGLGVWVLLGTFAHLAERTDRFRALAKPGLWGMSIAHIGLAIFIFGAVAQTSFKTETTKPIAIGETIAFAGRSLTLMSVEGIEGKNYYADRASFSVDGRTLSTEKRFYPAAQVPTTEVGIRTGIDGDLYLALGDRIRGEGTPRWSVRFYHNPMMYLIFWGVTLMGFGGLAALFERVLTARLPKAQAAEPRPTPTLPATEQA
jgi:cytochrome c-type biogenesis protein CcmF